MALMFRSKPRCKESNTFDGEIVWCKRRRGHKYQHSGRGYQRVYWWWN